MVGVKGRKSKQGFKDGRRGTGNCKDVVNYTIMVFSAKAVSEPFAGRRVSRRL